MRSLTIFVAVFILGAAPASVEASGSSSGDRIVFQREDGNERALSLAELRARCRESIVSVDDPYHGKRMRYAALPLRCVLDAGFDGDASRALRDKGLLLRALDGYTRPVSGRVLLGAGGYLAFGEPDRLGESASGSRFSPIDRRQVDPAPFYLVWTGREEGDPDERPWPYQLTRIEVASFAKAFPRTVPRGLRKDDPGWAGYALFQQSCASCHAINGEGGRVGPDLNVPRSIVDYRPIPQIRAYIRNPGLFRYTSMPAHPGLDEDALDALIAYFQAMSARKQDPASRGDS